MEKYTQNVVSSSDNNENGMIQIARHLCNIANEKAIANRIEAIKFLYGNSTQEERVKLLDELRHI